MKRQTRLIALFCVLAVAVGAAVGLSLYSEEAEQIAESGEVVFELPVDEVTALSWEYTDEEGETVSLAFTNDGGWSYDGDAAFPVDGEALTELLDYFAAMPAAFVIEDVTDYGQYGLEEPLCTIDITAGETEYEIALGDYSELDYQRYLSLGDGRAYLVNDDPMELYRPTPDGLRPADTLPAFVDVERVEFSGAQDYVIERDENGGSYRAGDVYYTENGEVLDTDSVNDFVTYIAALGLEDYYTYDATEADLAETGLDEPELTVTIDYPESGEEDAEILTFTISFSRSATDKLTDWDEVLAALEEESEDAEETAEPTDEDAVAYLRVGESAIIYEIGYDTFKAIMACSYDDLRHTEIFPAEVEDVASLSVTLDGGTYEFTTTPPEGAEAEDEGTQWYYEGEETGVMDIGTALAALSASRFDGGGASGEEEISLRATLASGDEIALSLYRADGESCYAEVDGEGIGYVPRSQAVDLIEAVNAVVLG